MIFKRCSNDSNVRNPFLISLFLSCQIAERTGSCQNNGRLRSKAVLCESVQKGHQSIKHVDTHINSDIMLNLLIIILNSIICITTIRLGISYYPALDLWEGEKLIMECRVLRSPQTYYDGVIWYKRSSNLMAEIISHGKILMIEDQRFLVEETVFEELRIYRLEV